MLYTFLKDLNTVVEIVEENKRGKVRTIVFDGKIENASRADF